MAQSDPVDDLVKRLGDALKAYRAKQTQIYQAAIAAGDYDSYKALDDEFRIVSDAIDELTTRQLVAHNPDYVSLTKEATEATRNIKASIDTDKAAVDILSVVAKAVDLVGRIVLMFGA